MSISAALANANSGLTASSKRAEVISDNVANALTEGYAAKEVAVSARMAGDRGAGVSVDGVTRRTDPRATAERRRAEAELGVGRVRADAAQRLGGIFGGPGEAGSLAARAQDLEDALGRLAETPESAALQADAAGRAGAMAGALNAASDAVQRLRMEADAAIGVMVGEINEALGAIETLNRDIAGATIAGRSTAALEESRERQVDRLAELVPVRTARREQGRIAIYAPGGAILLDGRAATLSFSPTGQITPDMTLASGALDGLEIDGRPIAVGTGAGPLDGAALGARFAIRDSMAPEAADQLDAVAEDLIRRFESPALDPGLAPGDPGLFTDDGAALDPLDLGGLAGRIALNAAVDPDQGGEPRRMRDGLASAVPGAAGEDDLPRAMLAALAAPVAVPAGAGFAGDRSFAGLVETVSADRVSQAARADDLAALVEGRHVALREAEAVATGVDGDKQMSDLLLVEQAYAANARVISTVDGLLRRLLEI